MQQWSVDSSLAVAVAENDCNRCCKGNLLRLNLGNKNGVVIPSHHNLLPPSIFIERPQSYAIISTGKDATDSASLVIVDNGLH